MKDDKLLSQCQSYVTTRNRQNPGDVTWFNSNRKNQMCLCFRKADFPRNPISPSVTTHLKQNNVQNWLFFFFLFSFLTTIKLVHQLPLRFTGTLSWHLNVKREGLNTKGSSLQDKKQINLKKKKKSKKGGLFLVSTLGEGTLESRRELWDTLQTLTCFQQFTHPASLVEFNGLNYSSHLIHSSQHALIGGFYWTENKSFWISQ